MNKQFLALLFFLIVAHTVQAAESLELKDENDKVNYSIGYQIGGDFVQQGISLNPEAIVKGINDAISTDKPLMTPQEMSETLVALKERIVTEQRQKASRAGEAFLAENRSKPGVVELPNGAQYRVLEEGKGATPTLQDTVDIHYRTLTIDGKEVASTYKESKPRSYPVAKMTPGFQEVLVLMREGAKWDVALPVKETGIKDQANLENAVLIYEIELVSVQTPAKK